MIRVFEVGGCVRDRLLGVESKDIDFSVEAPSFEAMREWMVAEGFKIYTENPDKVTIRAHFPKGHKNERLDADFVLCRREGPYSDGRRPDWVEVGTLKDDLDRRDFTVNAMALDDEGNLIDLHNGQAHLQMRMLVCVGSVQARFRQDALRAIRAMRFSITRGFQMDHEIKGALQSEWLPPLLTSVSTERKRDELIKCFKHDTIATLEMLERFPLIRNACFEDQRLWLKPSMEGRG